ncbi:hypothetical protein V2G26_000814 [Clonostachys chloroleuca]
MVSIILAILPSPAAVPLRAVTNGQNSVLFLVRRRQDSGLSREPSSFPPSPFSIDPSLGRTPPTKPLLSADTEIIDTISPLLLLVRNNGSLSFPGTISFFPLFISQKSSDLFFFHL